MNAALLIVSYRKDLPFFAACAKSVHKFTSGFSDIKVVVPTEDVELFKPHGLPVVGFDEEPGKGFLSHMRMKCYADHHFPNADFIFHLDSDSVFCTDVTPHDWLPGGRALLPYTDFKHFLTEPLRKDEEKHFMGFTGRKVDFNRGQYFWKFASDFALGFEVERETMAWMPIVHVREVYAKTREVVAARHGVTFDEYIFACRNEFPQTFCEFNALGGVAHKFFADRYEWHDLKAHGYPFVKVIQTWSHGGFDREHDFAGEVGGRQTPRQLFSRLGLT